MKLLTRFRQEFAEPTTSEQNQAAVTTYNTNSQSENNRPINNKREQLRIPLTACSTT